MNTKRLGVALGLGAGLAWALEVLFVKFALQQSSIVKTVAYVLLFALMPPIIYAGARKKSFKLNKNQRLSILFIGIIGTSFTGLLYYFALTKTAAINVILLSQLQPFFIIAIGGLFLKEKLHRYDYYAGIIIFVAVALVTSGNLGNLLAFRWGNIGDFIILIATLIWATAALVSKKYLMDLDTGVISFYRFGTAFILPFIWIFINKDLSMDTMFPIITGIIIGVGIIFYYESLKRLKTAQLAFVELSAPIFTAILAWFFLSELLTITQAIGIALLSVGVYLISKTSHHEIESVPQ